MTNSKNFVPSGESNQPISDPYSYTLSRAVYFHLKSNPLVRSSYSHQYTVINRHLFFVSPLGFEPRTHSLEGCCSIQLSYRDICVYGEIRTHIAHPFHLYCRAQCNIQAITHFCGSTSHLLHIYIISQGRRLTPTRFNVLFYNSRDGGTRTLTPCDTRS